MTSEFFEASQRTLCLAEKEKMSYVKFIFFCSVVYF